MELKHLITLSTLAKTLNFTKTGELLYLSHSTVSKHLTALEEEIGVQLIERDTHTVKLTEAGMLFMSRITQALDLLDEAQSVVCDSKKSGEMPQFRIGIDQMMQDNADILGKAMSGIFKLKKELPRLDVRILSMDRFEIESALQTDEIDIGLMICDLTIDYESSVFLRHPISTDTQLLIMPKVDGVRYELDNIAKLSELFNTAYIGNKKQIYPSAVPMFAELGIKPSIELVDGFPAILFNVQFHNGMTICPKSVFRALQLPDLVGIEISQSICITGCYKIRSTCPYIQPLLNIYNYDW